jgi:hypothetical protein
MNISLENVRNDTADKGVCIILSCMRFGKSFKISDSTLTFHLKGPT